MELDPVLLRIMMTRFEAIVEEMATIVVRSAYSAFIKETADIGITLITPGGEVFACPHSVAEKRLGMTIDPTLLKELSYEEGDLYISNDPRGTRGMATHLPDHMMWLPVFTDGVLLCFALGFVHTSDVGGLVPGSVSPNSVDIYQEGFILPPVKLFAKGELNADIHRLMITNTRTPDQNWGDIKAMVGALRVAERRLHELVTLHGRDVVRASMEELLNLAEKRARVMLRDIPDGRYTFWDYIDGKPGGEPIRIQLACTIKDSDAYLDFTGTDLQVRSGFNLFSYSKKHWQLIRGFTDYFRTLDETIPWNDGLLRPVHVDIPERSFLNPTPDAACGGRTVGGWRTYYMTLGALAQAVPTRVPASGPGQSGVVLVSSISPITHSSVVGVAEPLLGGGGARPFDDASEATEFAGAFLRNIPVEALENELNIKILKYGLRSGAGGAGLHRGGNGVEFTMQARVPYTTVVLRGTD